MGATQMTLTGTGMTGLPTTYTTGTIILTTHLAGTSTGTNGMAGASVGPPNSFIKGTATPSLVATTFGEVAVTSSVASSGTNTVVTHAAFTNGYVANIGDVITVSGHTGVAAHLAMNQRYVVASRQSATQMTLTGTGMTGAAY